MSYTPVNGIGGTVTAQVSGGSVISFAVKKWTGKIQVDKLERTHGGSAGYKVKIPGNGDFTGSMECFLDSTQIPDTVGTNVLSPIRHLSGGVSDATKYYVQIILTLGNSGKAYTLPTAFIEGLEHVSDTAEGCTFTCNFESSGTFSGPA